MYIKKAPGPLAGQPYNCGVEDVPYWGVATTPALPAVQAVRGPVYAVGAGGYLSVCDRILVAPQDRRASLDALMAALGGGAFLDPAGLDIGRPELAVRRIYGDALVLSPGETVSFQQPIETAVFALAQPFLGTGGVAGPFVATSDPLVPACQPVLRVWREPTQCPTVSVQRVSFQLPEFTPPVNLAGVSSALGTLARIPPGTEQVTVYLYGAAGRLVAETPDVEIWWMNQYNMWMHNENDDFDAGGLGSGSAAHDSETYNVPKTAIAMTVLQPVTVEVITAAFFAF